MARNYVFIITFARSGSSLVQAVLNCHDGCYIAGENNNFLYSAYESFQKYSNAREKYGLDERTRSPSHPWYGVSNFDAEQFSRDIKALVDNAVFSAAKDASVVGFKEVRYPYIPDLAAYLDFIKNTFGKVSFIFNYRHIDDALSSGFYLDFPADKITAEREILERFCHVSKAVANDQFSNISHVLNYEEYVNDYSVLTNVVEQLGLVTSKEKIADVMKKPHSYTQTRFGSDS